MDTAIVQTNCFGIFGIVAVAVMLASCGPKYEQHTLPDGTKMRINQATKEPEVLTAQGWIKTGTSTEPVVSTHGCVVYGKEEKKTIPDWQASNYVAVDFPIARVACPSYDQGKHVGLLRALRMFFSLPEGEVQILIDRANYKDGEEKYTIHEFRRNKREVDEKYKLGLR